MIKETLASFGLNKKEIDTYLACLELGPSNATAISNKSGVARTTTHHICHQLITRGFLSFITKGNVLIFTAAPPEKLLYFIDQERKKLSDREEEVNRVIGEMNKIMNPHSVLPKVKFFEKQEGIEQAYEEFIRSLPPKSTVSSYTNLLDDDFKKKYPNFLEQAKKVRIEKEISVHLLTNATKRSAEKQKKDKAELRETRIRAKEKIKGFGDLFICENKILLCGFKENSFFACIIENQIIADLQQSLFDGNWEQAKEK